jgi:hypothetical protein
MSGTKPFVGEFIGQIFFRHRLQPDCWMHGKIPGTPDSRFPDILRQLHSVSPSKAKSQTPPVDPKTTSDQPRRYWLWALPVVLLALIYPHKSSIRFLK